MLLRETSERLNVEGSFRHILWNCYTKIIEHFPHRPLIPLIRLLRWAYLCVMWPFFFFKESLLFDICRSRRGCGSRTNQQALASRNERICRIQLFKRTMPSPFKMGHAYLVKQSGVNPNDKQFYCSLGGLECKKSLRWEEVCEIEPFLIETRSQCLIWMWGRQQSLFLDSFLSFFVFLNVMCAEVEFNCVFGHTRLHNVASR